MATHELSISPPSAEELDGYFHFRWQQLRAPWGKEKGSERDEFDTPGQPSYQLCARFGSELIGVARIHEASPGHWQIRYMAVAPNQQGGGIGSRLLRELESHAWARSAEKIHLNAREEATVFYQKNAYQITGPGPLLWGKIPHWRMEKSAPASQEIV
ncbi:MAG: GNAT family N-acetyltransferase [Verrucomicrobiales bacterium]